MYGLSQHSRQKSLSPGRAKSGGDKSKSPARKRSRRPSTAAATTESASSEGRQSNVSSSSAVTSASAAIPHSVSSPRHQRPSVSQRSLTSTFSSLHPAVPSFLSSVHGVLPFPLWSSSNPAPLPEPPAPPSHRPSQLVGHSAVCTGSATLPTATSSRG